MQLCFTRFLTINPYPDIHDCKAFANSLEPEQMTSNSASVVVCSGSKPFATLSICLPNFEQIDITLMWSRRQFKADHIFAAGEGLNVIRRDESYAFFIPRTVQSFIFAEFFPFAALAASYFDMKTILVEGDIGDYFCLFVEKHMHSKTLFSRTLQKSISFSSVFNHCRL